MREDDTRRLPHHRACQTLTGLTLDHLPRDGSLGRASHYIKGSVIWLAADRADSIYFLQRGQVAIRTSDRDGREALVRLIEAGEPFGELCVCAEGGGLRHTTANAVVDCDVLEITHAEFLAYLQNDRDALIAFVMTFCVRLSDAEQRLEVLAQRGAEERLGKLLLHLARGRGRPTAEATGRVALRMSHDELAQMAAMSRPHVTVTMGELRRRGLVAYGRNQPIVVDVAALAAYLLRESGGSG